MKEKTFALALLLCAVSCTGIPSEVTLTEGQSVCSSGKYEDFSFRAQFRAGEDAEAVVRFHTDGRDPSKGYEVAIHDGPIDGSCKTGSLLAVRNLYRTLALPGEWNSLEIDVRGENVAVLVNGVQVVNYTEPECPFRLPEYKGRLLSRGRIAIAVGKGTVELRDIGICGTPDTNLIEPSEPVDESSDRIIRLQQAFFPVIDYHVHLKGGLTKEMAHRMSMAYGINYGVAPNAGEGGVGRMLSDDGEVYEYFEEVKGLPFLCGVQGEGRKWMTTFSQEALGVFDYLFTDAMTISDHKGRNARIYRPEEVHYDGVSREEYMEHLVEQTVKILTNEPADIYANPTFIPKDMQGDYDKYWTDERIDRVLDVLEQNNIALEINPRYRIPGIRVIRKAKERGLKFTFGTNNADADFGRLEYCLEAIDSCGLTASDIWFPSMSVRASRVTSLRISRDGAACSREPRR